MGIRGNNIHLNENKKLCEEIFINNIIYPIPNKINNSTEFSFICSICNIPYTIKFRIMKEKYNKSKNILLCSSCSKQNTNKNKNINYDEIRKKYDDKIKYDRNVPYMKPKTIPRYFRYKDNKLNESNHKYVFMKYFLPTLNNIDEIYNSNNNIKILNNLFGGQYFKGTTYVDIITITYKQLILEYFNILEYNFHLWLFDRHTDWNNKLIKQYLDWLIYDIKKYDDLDEAHNLIQNDFINNKGSALFQIEGLNIYKLLCKYYPDNEWKEYRFKTKGYWNDNTNCRNAIINEFSDKRNTLCNIVGEDFKNKGLGGLYDYWSRNKCDNYNVIPSLMIKLFPEYNFKNEEFIKYKLEIEISKSIENNGYKCSRQYRFNDCRDKLQLPFDDGIIDQLPINILIEGDGEQHFYPNSFFGGINGFKDRIKHDLIKNRYILEHNMILVRISYNCIEQTEELIKQAINMAKNGESGIIYSDPELYKKLI